ncbi:sugar-binding transcriptional regulator [Wielerella bovis]|uniref:sugar-binding transcriptional regulator n=1 Tax=Wielerella bovis TaxID=2917790 RepID=UPI002019A036|nr:sugar-binding transcriptional regulator [Wielerella bovis]ULJ59811.1 sugar-binding transcriptional regulator [Wielerella bovis]ULJ62015.1 sugar-binding transcriptional regulator [Wielerella bovis]ULJ64241.1 sugar-binding transcriptional regulator [Wielerella bovis]ULJ67840.1 sugar-binding transcriptional regulator [Wielerella bovis]
MMDTPHSALKPRDIQAIDVVKLYYQEGKSQQEIATLMGLSRPTVAKLMQYASERGFLEIRINDPRDNHNSLTEQIKQRFGLSAVQLVPNPMQDDYAHLLQEIGQAGARMLEQMVNDGDVIAIEWSSSIQAMAQALQPQSRKQVKVVQLRGSDTQMQQGFNEAESIRLVCQAFDAIGETLPLPAVFDNVQTKNLVEQEQNIRRVLESARQSRIAVFTVGAPNRESLLFRSGFFTEQEMTQLLQRSVGSICARFLDDKGRICLPDLNNRTTGIALPDLRHKEQRLLIAGGKERVQAIRVALEYGYANRLVTDEQTAQSLLIN